MFQAITESYESNAMLSSSRVVVVVVVDCLLIRRQVRRASENGDRFHAAAR